MDYRELYQKIRFGRRIPVISHPLMTVGIALVIFTILWNLIPIGALYWILLPAIGGLVWMAGYGGREALADLIRLLQRLERNISGG